MPKRWFTRKLFLSFVFLAGLGLVACGDSSSKSNTEADANSASTPTPAATAGSIVDAVYISSVYAGNSGNYADGYDSAKTTVTGSYVDITIADITALSGHTWEVHYGKSKYNNVMISSLDIPSTWTLSNNDIIRIHPANSTIATDSNSKTNGVWNINITNTATASTIGTNFFGDAAIIWVWDVNTSTILNFFGYASNDTSVYLFSTSASDDLLSIGKTAADSGLWDTPSGSTTFPKFDYTDCFPVAERLYNKAVLADPSKPGHGKTAWKISATDGIHFTTSGSSVSPSTITPSTTTSITLTTGVKAYGSLSVGSVSADLSSLGAGTVTLYDNGSNGDTTSGDNIYSAKIDVSPAAGIYKINITAIDSTGSKQEQYSVSLVSSGKAVIFTGSDFETTPTTTTLTSAFSGYESTTAYDGSAGTALHFNGTLTANGTVFLTSAAGTSKGSFTKVSFRLKTVTALAKAIDVEFGNKTSSITVGQLFILSSIANTDPAAFSPSTGASFSYAATTIDTQSSWVKVTLDISGTTDTANQFMIRLGTGTYNFWIDEIIFE